MDAGFSPAMGIGLELKARYISEAPLVEWRAGRIHDPVERLRYLRRAMRVEKPTPRVRHRRISLRWVAPLALFMLLLVPAPIPSSTRALITREPAWVPAVQGRETPAESFPNVWQVEKTTTYEVFSNGLRVENNYAVNNEPRTQYPIYGSNGQIGTGTQPVGIVFHTTESHIVPFEEGQNNQLRRIAGEVLQFIRSKQCYHFVIDRFGRVFRVVQEADIANHAGWSIWADQHGGYINLNRSFIGVAFETQTEHGALPNISPAQVHAGRILTEQLRSKYKIAIGNCVTHAQVSVNPNNMRIGYHTDWAGNFPFADLGLTDNYAVPLPSLYLFGFEYDPVFVRSTGSRLWKGLLLAEDQVRLQAAAEGLGVPEYRNALQHRFKNIAAALLSQEPTGGKSNETN